MFTLQLLILDRLVLLLVLPPNLKHFLPPCFVVHGFHSEIPRLGLFANGSSMHSRRLLAASPCVNNAIVSDSLMASDGLFSVGARSYPLKFEFHLGER